MCLTLNSATEWTGSRFQVVVVCRVVGVVLIGFGFLPCDLLRW